MAPAEVPNKPYIRRLVRLQQFLENRHRIVHRGGERVFRRQPVVNGNHGCRGEVGDGNSLHKRTRVRVETAAVHVDEYPVSLGCRDVERLDDVASDAANRLLFDVHRIKLACFLCPADAEPVGVRAPLGERGLRT